MPRHKAVDAMGMIDTDAIGAAGPEVWATAFGVAIGVSVIAWLIIVAVRRVVTALAPRTRLSLDDLVVVAISKTRWVFSVAIGLWCAGRFVGDLPAQTQMLLGRAAWLLFLAQVAIWGTGVIDWQVNRIRRDRLKSDAATATTMGAVGILAKATLYVLLLILALDNLGFEVTALVAGLGVAGVAVALAVQNILGDLFASLSIVLDRPFVIGDYLAVDEFEGTVEQVGMKSTRIRSLSGEQLVFSNSDLLASRIRNYRRMEERRVSFGVGVTYETPHAALVQIPELIRAAIESHPRARFGRSHFKQFGDWSLEFESVYYIDDRDYELFMDVQQTINLETGRLFAAADIGFAYPTQTVLMRREPSASEPQAL